MDGDALTEQLSLIHSAEKLADRPYWLVIGSQDTRVGTDYAIAFARRMAAVADDWKQPAKVTLHVMPTKGHSSDNAAHDRAAEWILGLE